MLGISRAAGPTSCFSVIGAAVDLGDAVGLHIDGLSRDTSLRLPKAPDFTTQESPTATSQPGQLIGTGSCLDSTGQVTPVVQMAH